MKKSLIFVLFALGCSVPGKAPIRSSRSPFDPGAPAQGIRPKTFHVRHYALTLSFDEALGEVFARESIEFEPVGVPLRYLVLDAEGLQLESAAGPDGEPLAFETLPGTISIDLGSPLGAGKVKRVSIRYHAFPQRGLHFVRPDSSDPSKTAQVWSQGEQNDSHYWFACRDELDDFASSEVTGTVRDSETLVSNGRLLGVESHPESGTRTFHWKIDEPHAVYLTSIVVGTFAELADERGGVALSFFAPPSIGRETVMRSFGRTGEMLEYFSRVFGVGYPFTRYGQTIVEEFDGGMENVTATTVGDDVLHGPDDEPEERSDGLVAHELAHQWFGDLVTCASWSEVWLNEAFADYAGNLWTEHSRGTDEYRFEMLEAERAFLEEDRSRYRRPLVQSSYFDTADLFDHVTYEKGSWVLAMLRGVVGDRDFFRGVQIYLRSNAWKNVDTTAFETAMEEAVGGKLGWFFDEWVRGTGYPEFRVSSRYEAAEGALHVTVDQTQAMREGTPLFSMPVDLDFSTPSGFESHRLELSSRHQEFRFPTERAPSLVRFDPENRVLKVVRFDKSRDELDRQAREDPDLSGRIWAVGELSRRFANSRTAVELATIASSDRFYGVRVAAAQALEGFCDSGSSRALRRCLSDPDSRVRAEAAASLSSCRGTDDVLENLAEVLAGDRSGAVAGAAAESIGKLKGRRSFSELERALSKRPEPAARRGILLGLAQLDTPESREEVVKACGRGRPERMRRAAVAALRGVPGRAVDPNVQEVLEQLLEDPDLRIQAEAVRSIAALGLDRSVPALRRAARRSPMLREDVDSAIRRIESKGKKGASS